MNEAKLQEIESVIAAAPPVPYVPSGTSPNIYGFSYTFNGGTHQVGSAGDLLPGMVRMILTAAETLPLLCSEVRSLKTEISRLQDANKVLRTKVRN